MVFPIQLVLRGRTCVVVGGGRVAARKVEALCRVGADVHVISPDFEQDLLIRQDITRHVGPYKTGMLSGATLVMACTNDGAVNATVAADARAAGILVNVADDPDHCDFYVPAVVHRGPIRIAVGTGGASPELAATLRRLIEEAVPEAYGEFAAELARVRPIVKHRIAHQADRSRFFATLSGDESLRRFFQEGVAVWRTWFQQLLDKVGGT